MKLLSCSSVGRLCGAKVESEGVTDLTPLYLNVYDLTPMNNYFYVFGLGVFHSGIEAHGLEYGFGAHDFSSSGVFEVKPKSYPGFIFRRSILLGSINLSRSEFCSFVENLSKKYYGNTYNLLLKNCNHFSDEVCMQLTGKPIPGWVNRMARVGSFCNCLIPEDVRITAPDRLECSDNDDDSASYASSSTGGGEEMEANQLLPAEPNSHLRHLDDKPVKLVKVNM